MLSPQFVRENPEVVRRGLARRNTEAPLDEILALDAEWRQKLAEGGARAAERNAISKEIGALSKLAKTADTREAKHAEHRRSDLVARSTFLGERLGGLEAQVRELEERLSNLLLEIP